MTEEEAFSELAEALAKQIAARMAVRRNGHITAPWWCSPERDEALDYAKAVLKFLNSPVERSKQATLDEH